MNIAPDHITILKPNEVFVYGANLAGIHGSGAARTALKWGAVMGQYGFNGQTYGIPTKGCDIRTLDLYDIGFHIDHFRVFAESRPDLTFLVTEVGCGLARYTPKDIAPLFWQAARLPNVSLPASFWEVLNG